MHYDSKNIAFSRYLRKEMTPWERKLWYCFLKAYHPKFQRQKAIEHYIADFYCAKAGLIVELDGSGHYDPAAEKQDSLRTQRLEGCGLAVIRFSNLDVDRRFESVCTAIDNEVRGRMDRSGA